MAWDSTPREGLFRRGRDRPAHEVAGNIPSPLKISPDSRSSTSCAHPRSLEQINAAIVRIRERKARSKRPPHRVRARQVRNDLVGSIDHDKQQIEPIAWTGFRRTAAHAGNWPVSASQLGRRRGHQTRKSSVRTTSKPGCRRQAPTGGAEAAGLPLFGGPAAGVDGAVTAVVVLFAPAGLLRQGRACAPRRNRLGPLVRAAGHREAGAPRLPAYYANVSPAREPHPFLERVRRTCAALSAGHNLALYYRSGALQE